MNDSDSDGKTVGTKSYKMPMPKESRKPGKEFVIKTISWENIIYQNNSRNVKNLNRPLFYQTIENVIRVTP